MRFLDRSRRTGRFFEWKVRLFSLAAVLTIAGLYFDERWMTGAAIGVLLASLTLRFLPGGATHLEAVDEGSED